MESQLNADNRSGLNKTDPTGSTAADEQKQENMINPSRTSSRNGSPVTDDGSTTPKISPSGSLNRNSSAPSATPAINLSNSSRSATPRRTSSFFHNRERFPPTYPAQSIESKSPTLTPSTRGHTKTPSIGGLSLKSETPNQVRMSLYSEASGYSPIIEHATKVKLSDSSVHEQNLTRARGLSGRSVSDSDKSNHSASPEIAPRKNSDDHIDKARESRYGLQSILTELQYLRRSTSGSSPLPLSPDSTAPLSTKQRYPGLSTESNQPVSPDLQKNAQQSLPPQISSLRHNVPLRTHNGHGRSFSVGTDISHASNSSSPQYPALLSPSSSSKIGKSPMPVMTGSTIPSSSSQHWHGENFSSSAEDVDNLIASLDKFRPKLQELQESSKRSSMIARIPSSGNYASNDTHSSSSGFSYTSTPVKYDFPPFPMGVVSGPTNFVGSYSWQHNKDNMDGIGLSPPPSASQLFDDRRDSQDSSNESFQTAASHPETDLDDMLGQLQRQEYSYSHSNPHSPVATTSSSRFLQGDSDISHSSSANTVVPPGRYGKQRSQKISQPSLSSFGSTTTPGDNIQPTRESTVKLKNAASIPVLVPVVEAEPIRRSIRASMMSHPHTGSDDSQDSISDRKPSAADESLMHSEKTRTRDGTTYTELIGNGQSDAKDMKREGGIERARKEKTRERSSKLAREQEWKSQSRYRTSATSRKQGNIQNINTGSADGLFNNRATGVSSTSKTPRKAVFSQPNIRRLLDLAEESFDLDQIDLPPDEKHLLEKFIDALSKLSVEINLDNGKKIEGKRRLHNALRAIEGWI